MTQRRFELTAEHVKLLARANVSDEMRQCEYGAPCIDPKRPYGNSDVMADIAEILGWTFIETDDGPVYPKGTRERAKAIHDEIYTALSVVLRAQTFEPGVYVADTYRDNWRRMYPTDMKAKDEADAC